MRIDPELGVKYILVNTSVKCHVTTCTRIERKCWYERTMVFRNDILCFRWRCSHTVRARCTKHCEIDYTFYGRVIWNILDFVIFLYVIFTVSESIISIILVVVFAVSGVASLHVEQKIIIN